MRDPAPDRLTSSVARAPSGIIAVVRAPTPEEALTIGRGLARAGVDAVEITLTVPGAVEVIAELVRQDDVLIGAGTVLSPAAAEAVSAAGAAFLVSPDTDPDVVRMARDLRLPMIPGALTPTEVRRASELGAAAVKLFPIGAVGGPGYVRTLLEPFPDIRLVVSGGVSLESVAEFLAAGTHAVCLGSALIDRKAAAAGDVDAVERFGRHALETIDRTGRN